MGKKTLISLKQLGTMCFGVMKQKQNYFTMIAKDIFGEKKDEAFKEENILLSMEVALLMAPRGTGNTCVGGQKNGFHSISLHPRS